MTTKKTIVVSASVAAAAIPVLGQAADLRQAPAPAPAPAAAENPFFVSIEGGAAFSDFGKNSTAASIAQTKLGKSPQSSVGPYGSISIGRKIEATAYDWRISASATQLLKNKEEGSYGPYAIGTSNVAGFQSADFDIGRNMKSDLFEARVFAGVRALNASASEAASENALGYFGGSIGLTNRFLGVGPRVGADVRVGNELGLVASVSAAALYGKQTQEQSLGYTYFGYNLGYGQADAKYDWVTDVAASLAASWKPSKSTEIAAGYRAEKLMNVNAPQGGTQITQSKDVVSHGPFLKVGVKF